MFICLDLADLQHFSPFVFGVYLNCYMFRALHCNPTPFTASVSDFSFFPFESDSNIHIYLRFFGLIVHSSGALHFIASNNDCGAREYDMERYLLCKNFRFDWPVNVSALVCFSIFFSVFFTTLVKGTTVFILVRKVVNI